MRDVYWGRRMDINSIYTELERLELYVLVVVVVVVMTMMEVLWRGVMEW